MSQKKMVSRNMVGMKSLALLICLISVLILTPKVQSQSVQYDHAIFSCDSINFLVDYPASMTVKTGEEFSITFDFSQLGYDINVEDIMVEVYGNIGQHGEWSDWNYTWANMTMYSNMHYTAIATFNILSIPASIEQGGVYARASGSGTVLGKHSSFFVNFGLLTIHEETYQEITDALNSLNQTSQNLQQENSNLKTNLSSSQTLSLGMVIALAGTVLILISTTIYFVRKKKRIEPTRPPPKT